MREINSGKCAEKWWIQAKLLPALHLLKEIRPDPARGVGLAENTGLLVEPGPAF